MVTDYDEGYGYNNRTAVAIAAELLRLEL